jgi:hypothetical protein
MLFNNNFNPKIIKNKNGIPTVNNNNIPCNQNGMSESKGVSMILNFILSDNEEENIITIDAITTPNKAMDEKNIINAPIIFAKTLNTDKKISPIVEATWFAPDFAVFAIF